MHHLSEAMPESRKPGSSEGRTKFQASFFCLFVVVAFCLLCGLQAQAGGVVSGCSKLALLSAINDVDSGDVVTFDEDCTMTFGKPIVITNTVTIDASGFDVTLSGGSASQLFIVQDGGSLELIGLTLSNGRATNGGAIFIDANGVATITDCTFIQNAVSGVSGTNGVNGGSSSGTGGNGGNGRSSGGAWGGAIFNAGDLTIETTTFSTNSATGGNGGNGGNGGGGGG